MRIDIGYAEPQQAIEIITKSIAWTDVVMALTAVLTVVLMLVGIYFRVCRKGEKDDSD
jgi:hypothetical protein